MGTCGNVWEPVELRRNLWNCAGGCGIAWRILCVCVCWSSILDGSKRKSSSTNNMEHYLLLVHSHATLHKCKKLKSWSMVPWPDQNLLCSTLILESLLSRTQAYAFPRRLRIMIPLELEHTHCPPPPFFSLMLTTVPICQFKGTAPDLHARFEEAH